MNTYPDHRQLYRLPWTLPDNPIVWLEPTATCNIYCEGCYRARVKDGHKSLDTIRDELETFARFISETLDARAANDGEPPPDLLSMLLATVSALAIRMSSRGSRCNC